MKTWLLGLLACAVLGSAHAADAPAPALTCGRADEQALHGIAYPAESTVDYSDAQRQCWLHWKPAQAIATGPLGMWIDVRDAGTQRQVALAGATTVGLADLADKAFLHGQSLVLVGSGVDLEALSSRCVALRRSGQFKDVHVLLGGVRAWRLAGAQVRLGDGAAPADEVGAQDLWRGASEGLWRIATLGVSAGQSRRLPALVDFAGSGPDLAGAMSGLSRRMAATGGDQPQRQWLAVAATPEQQSQARRLWQQASAAADPPLPPLYWLSGGWPEYLRYLDQQQTLAAHAGRSLPRLCGI